MLVIWKKHVALMWNAGKPYHIDYNSEGYGMELRVRPMQHYDIDSVYAIELAGHRSPWSRDILRDCVLVNYDCRVIEVVTNVGIMLAGYVICRYDEKMCHILNLCIKSTLQGKGYGQFLLRNVINTQKNTPVDTIILEVRPSNIVAIHVYQKIGFQQTGIKPGYYHDENIIEDAVILQKKLGKGSKVKI
jgi:ribosomal-protein-alanine N-acetyltransferase